MNHHKLTALDETIFDLLDYTQTTSQVFSQVRFTSRNTCVQSLRRLELFGLVTQIKGHRAFAKGISESQWKRAVETFPGVMPRKNAREDVVDDAPGPGELPLQLRRPGQLPDWIAGRMGLAGLVAQISS